MTSKERQAITEDVNRRQLADKYVGQECIIVGRDNRQYPARIYGRLNKFAWVASLDCQFAAEFTWYAVDNIMSNEVHQFFI